MAPLYDTAYLLDVDASDYGLGGVISQIQNGEEKVIAYSSRTLTPAEKNYCATRKELLSLVYHLKKFKYYLLGGKTFRIRTDHGALTWLKSSPEPIGQNARWVEILQEYDFTIEHRSGSRHQNCDALSRIPVPCKQYKMSHGEFPKEEPPTVLRSQLIQMNEPTLDSDWNQERLIQACEDDLELKTIKELLERSPPASPLKKLMLLTTRPKHSGPKENG